ncbi:MAG: serine/threonine-protein kinase, partial [Longimicrobiales bacterium]|nr:serine/threonine-protein kinase [Longimicrobiales bacterium]
MSEMIDRLNAALEGRYRIERELGQGGMATVYLAEDLKHSRKVALKVLKPELAAVVGGERFLTEIETTANLTHPNILPLFDSGEADSFLFYVMPYIEGDNLRDRLDGERQLSVDEAVRIATEVADALDYAHRHGVVHRDVKPANVLLHEGRPMVADFGIALAVSAAGGGRITETGLSLGTPHYMSPEQASGDRDVDPRTDVYALGCVLYEMLAGEPPYGGPTAQSVLARILTEEPRRVTEIRRTVPRHVDAVVTKALEKLPADRFDSAAAFKAALEDEGFRHEREGSGSARLEPTASSGTGSRSRSLVAALAVALLLAAGLAVAGWLRPSDAPPVSRLEVNVDPPVALNWGPAFAISPDGRLFLYRGPDGQLFVRSMSNLDPEPIPLTEGARTPAFSPDGESVVYHIGSPGDDELRTFSLSGSPPVRL